MAKEIRYPSKDWIDRWVDSYMDEHPNERIDDFKELEAKAEDAWWLNEVEHDRPTPFDLTPEQEKVSHEARVGYAKADPEKPKEKQKRERKPNEEKRDIVQILADAMKGAGFADVSVPNIEREVAFKIGDNSYSITLTLHRGKKKGE